MAESRHARRRPLSGFLITTLLLEEHSRSGRIAVLSFYSRRARRLLPALLVLAPLVLLGVVTLMLGGPQFYIVWPLFLVVPIRRGGSRLVGRAVGLLLFVAVLYRLQLLLRGASISRVYYGPDTHADALLVGCGFGCYFVRDRMP